MGDRVLGRVRRLLHRWILPRLEQMYEAAILPCLTTHSGARSLSNLGVIAVGTLLLKVTSKLA